MSQSPWQCKFSEKEPNFLLCLRISLTVVSSITTVVPNNRKGTQRELTISRLKLRYWHISINAALLKTCCLIFTLFVHVSLLNPVLQTFFNLHSLDLIFISFGQRGTITEHRTTYWSVRFAMNNDEEPVICTKLATSGYNIWSIKDQVPAPISSLTVSYLPTRPRHAVSKGAKTSNEVDF